MVSKFDKRVTITTGGVWRGFRDLFVVAAYSIPFGIAFGTAAAEGGLSAVETIAMSVLVFSGTAQFAALDAITGQAGLLSLGLVVFAVSARFVVMGAALAPHLNGLPPGRRLAITYFISDPNFAQAQAEVRSGRHDAGVLLGGGLALWVNWIAGTAIGALAGNVVGDVKALGFDVVMICFFVTVVVGEARLSLRLIPLAVAAGAAVFMLGWLPAGWNIIAAAFAGGLVSVICDDD